MPTSANAAKTLRRSVFSGSGYARASKRKTYAREHRYATYLDMQPFSRRRFLLTASATLAAARISRSAPQQEIVPKLLDHILLGCPNLEEGIAYVEERLGVRAAFGGVHPGVG